MGKRGSGSLWIDKKIEVEGGVKEEGLINIIWTTLFGCS